jgi:hypothetical protein
MVLKKKGLITGAASNFKGEDLALLNTGSTIDFKVLRRVTLKIMDRPVQEQETIRGLGTIGNSNPLYIVDGITVEILII